MSLVGVRYVHPFLAVADRISAPILVIEGWSPAHTMKQAASEFNSGHYQRGVLVRSVLTVGDKYESGRYSGDYVTALLVQYGVPAEQLKTLFPNVTRKDRTYHSALAVRESLHQEGISVTSLEVATVGAHARRSRLLYQKAFGDNVKIGIIPLDDIAYDSSRWWASSEGVRDVIGECIAYFYARIFFHPSDPESNDPTAPKSRGP